MKSGIFEIATSNIPDATLGPNTPGVTGVHRAAGKLIRFQDVDLEFPRSLTLSTCASWPDGHRFGRGNRRPSDLGQAPHGSRLDRPLASEIYRPANSPGRKTDLTQFEEQAPMGRQNSLQGPCLPDCTSASPTCAVFSRQVSVIELQLDHLQIHCGLDPAFWRGHRRFTIPGSAPGWSRRTSTERRIEPRFRWP